MNRAPLTPAPTLLTERLTLRGPVHADRDVLTTWVTTSLRLAQMDEQGDADDAWHAWIAGIGHWHHHGYGFFTLCHHDDPTPLGRVGLLKHNTWDDVELAWHLFDTEGHGYATEAAQAVRTWAFETIKPPRLVSYIDVTNTRSQAVATRLGATNTMTFASHDAESHVWEHPSA